MSSRTHSPVVLAEAALVGIVALWLLLGLLSTPLSLGVVLAFAALPLLFVVLPAALVRAAGDDGRVHLRLRLPMTVRRGSEGPVALTDGGRTGDEASD
jgi:hypothetical protein